MFRRPLYPPTAAERAMWVQRFKGRHPTRTRWVTIPRETYPRLPEEVFRFTTTKEFMSFSIKHGARVWHGVGSHIRVEKNGEHDTWVHSNNRQLSGRVRKATMAYLVRAGIGTVEPAPVPSRFGDDDAEEANEGVSKHHASTTTTYNAVAERDARIAELEAMLEKSWDAHGEASDEIERRGAEIENLKKTALDKARELEGAEMRHAKELEAVRLQVDADAVEARDEAAREQVRKFEEERDAALVERDRAIVERDGMQTERDRALFSLNASREAVQRVETLENDVFRLEKERDARDRLLNAAKRQLEKVPQMLIWQQVATILVPLKARQLQILGQQYNILIDLKTCKTELEKEVKSIEAKVVKAARRHDDDDDEERSASSAGAFSFSSLRDRVAFHVSVWVQLLRYRLNLWMFTGLAEHFVRTQMGTYAMPFWKETNPERADAAMHLLRKEIQAAYRAYEQNVEDDPVFERDGHMVTAHRMYCARSILHGLDFGGAAEQDECESSESSRRNKKSAAEKTVDNEVETEIVPGHAYPSPSSSSSSSGGGGGGGGGPAYKRHHRKRRR